MRLRDVTALFAASAAFGWVLATNGTATEDEFLARVSVEHELVNEVGDRVYRVHWPSGEYSVEPSCECVTISAVSRDGLSAMVRCSELPRFVIPGVYVALPGGAEALVELPCAP